VVSRDLPGVSTGREEDKLGLKGSSTTDLMLENTPVPAENLRVFVTLAGVQNLGEELKKVGRALRDPISQIGVLSDFAVRKIRQAISDEQFPDMRPPLTGTAIRAARYAGERPS